MAKHIYSTDALERRELSEFNESGYDCSALISIFRELLSHDFTCENDMIDAFNEMVINDSYWTTITRHFVKILEKLDFFDYVDYIDTYDEHRPIDVSKYINPYFFRVQDISLKLLEKGKVFDPNLSNKYLDCFFDLSKNVVFSPDSIILDDDSFRKSKFLQDLLLLFSTKAPTKRSGNNLTNHYIYNIFEPFAYDSLQRILLNIKYFKNDTKEFSTITKKLEMELFLRRAERVFNRFAYYNGKTYRISLNRHDSLLYSSPYDELSSIEEVKPIRLFEKIATYIQKSFNKTKENTINICIIGHTEKSKNREEKELYDLMNALLIWFNNNFSQKYDSYLKLNITNIVSENDWPKSNFSNKREAIQCEVGRNVANCEIQQVNFNNTFSFNTRRIGEAINKNDIVFILDCPWLTTENYDIKQASSIDYFCKSIQSKERHYIDENNFIESRECLFSKKPSIFKELDSQYNRIMASKTNTAGQIVRVFKDRLIKKIQQIVTLEKSPKEVYIFSSEEYGLTYSYTSIHPLTRIEQYDGKSMNIIKFCNYKTQTLSYSKDDISINIRLWSILKYLSVSYAYNQFKEIITDCFVEYKLETLDYFEIYRNIIIKLDVKNDLSNLNISVCFSEQFDTLIKKITNADYLISRNIKYKICHLITKFISELCTKIIFSKENYMFSDSIKRAFLMNIYSSVTNVKEMLFWHKCRMAIQNNSFDDFKISFSANIDNDIHRNISDSYTNDFFMDKKVYDKLLYSLEYGDEISMGIENMLLTAERTFNVFDYKRKVLFDIYRSCRDTNIENISFLENLLKMIERTIKNE